MPRRIEKTVFISYRRTNLPWARAIYQDLTAHGYDAFFDFQSIDSGDFSQIILENIRGRAHFLVLLTPSALKRCENPNDWLRREIETAIDTKRNIVPLIFESFDFGSPRTQKALTGKLALLKNYNGLKIYSEYFDEGMARLRERYLNITLDAVLHPISSLVEKATKEHQTQAQKTKVVKKKELTAQEWFEKGYKSSNPDEQIYFYTEAIHLEPDDAVAYYNRGLAHYAKGELGAAIKDYGESLRLELDQPDAFDSRGLAHAGKGDLENAIKDYNESIRLEPNYANTYFNRAMVWEQKKGYSAAIADYEKYLELGGGVNEGDQKDVEEIIRKLKRKITRKKSAQKKIK